MHLLSSFCKSKVSRKLQWKECLRFLRISSGNRKSKMMWSYWMQKSLMQSFKCKLLWCQKARFRLFHARHDDAEASWQFTCNLNTDFRKSQSRDMLPDILTVQDFPAYFLRGMLLKHPSNSRYSRIKKKKKNDRSPSFPTDIFFCEFNSISNPENWSIRMWNQIRKGKWGFLCLFSFKKSKENTYQKLI